jgi:hypothetical protein
MSHNLSAILIAIGLSSYFLHAGCKTINAPYAKPKHIFGRTAISPSSSEISCEDGKTHPEAVRYVRQVASWMMQKNPETFGGPYSPSHFCFAVGSSVGMNASASVENKKIFVSIDLLKMESAKDADIAAVLAHELAHITMQHKQREPDAVDFPADYDPVEGNRRLEVLAKWKAAVHASRSELVHKAEEAKVFADATVVMRDSKILARLRSNNPPQDSGQYEESAKAISKLLGAYPEVIANPIAHTLESWQFLDLLSMNLHELLESSQTLNAYVQNGPEICLLSHDCSDKKILRHLINFSKSHIKPGIQATVGLTLAANDDPNQYAPYIQWTEQQADEVGFEIYLRAGLNPDRFTTYLEQMMKSDQSFAECVDKIQKHTITPSRNLSDVIDAHPAFCFRYHDIKVSEMKLHDADYKSLILNATLETIPGLEGILQKLRSTIF